MHEHPQPHAPGEHLQGQPVGGVGEPLRALPQPVVDEERAMQGLQGMALLRRERPAPVRRRRQPAVVQPEEANIRDNEE